MIAVVMTKTSWTVAEAEAKFSEVIGDALSKGPQTITKDGHGAVVLVSIEEWERRTKRSGNLAAFFAGSPLRDSQLFVKRSSKKPRALKF